jgi:hypothetical protein
LKTITLRFQNFFIRAENDEGCYGTGQFDIIVEPIPKSKLLKKILCDGSGLSIILESGILFPALTADYARLVNRRDYAFHRSIKEGDYTVVVTNEQVAAKRELVTSLYLILQKYKI